MRRSIIFVFVLIIMVGACNSTKRTVQSGGAEEIATADNSRNSLDWAGVYLGTLPCADCEGIRTEIRLNNDLSYKIATKYLGKSDQVYQRNGHFKWNETGSKIILEEAEGRNIAAGQYLVGENMLIALDIEGNRIQSTLPPDTYMLKKVLFDQVITEKYWKLIELHGKEFILADSQKREPYFILRTENNRITGNGGCNTFNGSYEILSGNRIRFSGVVSTMMACMDVDYEKEYLDVLVRVDNYTLSGDTLSLNKARMAPLAKFVAVYL
ncbi:MAG: copper resistance protein NlpE N-terminal domain-containing protein [Mangrovibacterium sp.]